MNKGTLKKKKVINTIITDHAAAGLGDQGVKLYHTQSHVGTVIGGMHAAVTTYSKSVLRG